MNKVKVVKKAVIKPMLNEICAEIINGECLEIPSKNKPRELKPPFKCYIYCYKNGDYLIRQEDNSILNGTIICEFICSKIIKNQTGCLLIPTNLKIYDKPKKINEFKMLRGTLKNWCYVEELEE